MTSGRFDRLPLRRQRPRPGARWANSAGARSRAGRPPPAGLGRPAAGSAPVRDGAGTIKSWISSIIDIDEAKQAEQAVRRSERRFRQLADAMPQIVWMATPDGTVDYV